MAEPDKQYEYGRTPEETDSGVLGFFNFLSGPVVDAFTPERREVITAPETTYENLDGRYYPKTTPGEYGPVEEDLEHMPVVQSARAALDFAGKFATDGKVREETGSAIEEGIGQIFKDYQEGLTAGAMTGETSSYDPEEKRVVEPDFLLPLGLGMAASLVAPVKGPGVVAGMFAGRKAATARPKNFKSADEMAKKGRSREEIWKKTGLFRWERNGEPISDWRFEISDEQAKAFFNPRVQTPTGRFKAGAEPVLSDLFEHPEFYKNYPGKMDVSGSSLMDDLQKKRAVLVTKLAELKASNKDPDEYAKEYQKLQDQDGDLLREYLESDIPEVKTSITGSEKVGPPYTTKAQRMEKPVEGISIKSLSSKGNTDAAATYNPSTDRMSFKALPGGKNLYDAKKDAWIPWDDQGRFFQKFSDVRYGEVLDDAKKDFRKAGISLDTTGGGNAPAGADINNPAFGIVYKMRKWKGGPEDTIDPESLPDYLKKQFDELQAGGRTFYKQEFDADRLFRGNTIHEGQHAIQYREGFEGGGRASEFRYTNIKDPQTGKKLSKKEVYMRTLGEAEARLADSRKDLTDKERKERFPWTKEGGLDRREEDLILRKDPGMPASYYDDPISASMTPAENLMKTRPVIKEPEVFFKGDLGKLQAADSPDGMKAILFDDEDYGKELLGELRTGDTLNPASLKQLNTLKKKVYDQTQESIAELPDVLSVYRIGKLGRNDASEPVSFSLTPDIPLSGLPWYKDKGLSIQEYKVNKSDILAAPNAIFRKGKGSADEQEVIIRGTDVTPAENLMKSKR